MYIRYTNILGILNRLWSYLMQSRLPPPKKKPRNGYSNICSKRSSNIGYSSIFNTLKYQSNMYFRMPNILNILLCQYFRMHNVLIYQYKDEVLYQYFRMPNILIYQYKDEVLYQYFRMPNKLMYQYEDEVPHLPTPHISLVYLLVQYIV